VSEPVRASFDNTPAIVRIKVITLDQLMAEWNWRPIRNCPGRYVLQDVRPDLSIKDLLGSDAEVRTFHVDGARDEVLISFLDTGGVISYKRADGSYLHTLNTQEGFERKLLNLGICA
jgi:hypothetical protein